MLWAMLIPDHGPCKNLKPRKINSSVLMGIAKHEARMMLQSNQKATVVECIIIHTQNNTAVKNDFVRR